MVLRVIAESVFLNYRNILALCDRTCLQSLRDRSKLVSMDMLCPSTLIFVVVATETGLNL